MVVDVVQTERIPTLLRYASVMFGLMILDPKKKGKQGNRLTRRPCKGDEFEIVIFEGKRENAGICRSRQKMCTTWTFISIGRRVTQE